MRPIGPLALAVATVVAIGAATTAGTATGVTSSDAAMAPKPAHQVVGVTVDTTSHLSRTIASLRALPGSQWVRLVMDINRHHPHSVGNYPAAAKQLAATGPVMGELADSSELKEVTAGQLATRTKTYVESMGRDVTVWEIGNEVNGNWTGKPSTVATKVISTYRSVRAAGADDTALTLYENQGCGDGPGEASPAAWSRQHLPRSVRDGLTYVLLSYYERQCHNDRPSVAQWRSRFTRLHSLFPNAELGFGEIGMANPATGKTQAAAASIIKHYYRLDVGLPYVIGGDFYWYYAEDMTPWRAAPLWRVLDHAIA